MYTNRLTDNSRNYNEWYRHKSVINNHSVAVEIFKTGDFLQEEQANMI